MINQRFVITHTDLNVGDPIVLNVEIIKTNTSVTGNADARKLHPQEIQIINDCGAPLEWLSLNSAAEYAEYVANPSSFTFVRLLKTYILQDDFTSFGRCYKFIIHATALTATSSLTVEFIGYKNSPTS